MSLFFKKFNPGQIAKAYRVLNTAQVRHFEWYPDVKPGPYPRTKEEREAAAKKYNLLPEEYEPFPEDTDDVCGDYPNLPVESVDSKDPWYPWDNVELRKNFGDPLPKNIIILLPEALSTEPPEISHLKGTLIFFGTMGFFFIILYFLCKFNIEEPIMAKAMVVPGVKHYTFELVGDDKKHST